MTPLETLLARYRTAAQTEREKGTYFEELIRTYFRHEASYTDLYSDVWLFGDWAREIGRLYEARPRTINHSIGIAGDISKTQTTLDR